MTGHGNVYEKVALSLVPRVFTCTCGEASFEWIAELGYKGGVKELRTACLYCGKIHALKLIPTSAPSDYKYHCSDCGKDFSKDEYPYHNADHSIRKISIQSSTPNRPKGNCPDCGQPFHEKDCSRKLVNQEKENTFK